MGHIGPVVRGGDAKGGITFFTISSSKAVAIHGPGSCISTVVKLTNNACSLKGCASRRGGTLSAVGVRVRSFCSTRVSTSILVCGKAVRKRLASVSRLMGGGDLFTSFRTMGDKRICAAKDGFCRRSAKAYSFVRSLGRVLAKRKSKACQFLGGLR